MALKDFRPVTQELELRNPKDDSPLGIKLKVVGPDSKEVRTAERLLQKESIARSKKGTEVEIEEIEEILIRKFAAAVIGWDEQYNEEMGGAYSAEYILSLFNDSDYRWVVHQVSAYCSERQNFFR
jgi:hypothetical protein